MNVLSGFLWPSYLKNKDISSYLYFAVIVRPQSELSEM